MNLRKAFLPVTTFARIDIKRLFRDKMAIFFVFIFPMIFLLIFGFIFRGDSVSFRVALINQSDTEFSRKFVSELQNNKVFKIQEDVTTIDQAKERMGRSQLDAAIILPAGFGATQQGQNYPSGEAQILYDQNNEQGAQTLGSVMESIFTEINKQFVTIPTPFSVHMESTSTKGLTRFDYTFAGLLGFTMLSLGIFGPTNVFPRLKQKGVLRRYHTTTLKVWQYFIGNVISNAAVGLMAVALMFVPAFLIFDLNMRGDFFNLGIVVVLGVTIMFGIGLAIGGWAKNENQAAPLAQLTTLPMMFLSGVFIPVFVMPEALQKITKFIPLTPIVDSVRLVITEGKTVLDLGPQMAIMFVWLVVIYVIAFKVFRWE